MMDQSKGIANDVVGKVQDTFGAAAGDAAAQVEGKVRQAAGKLQKGYGEAVSGLRDAATSNPFTTLAVVAGVGVVLGAMWMRRR